MTPFNEGPPPADDFGSGRWDEVGLPVTSPNSGVEYSEPAGLILTPPEADPPRVLRVTSATATSGLYPARLEDWDDAAAAPRLADASAAQDCWAQGPNGEALAATRYDGVFLGYHSDGLPVYGVAGLASPLTVQDVNQGTGDTATSVSGVTTLQTDEAAGLSVVSVSAGVAKLVLQPASDTHAGGISMGDQLIPGGKIFLRGVGFDTTTWLTWGLFWEEIQGVGASGSFNGVATTNVEWAADGVAAAAETNRMRPPVGAGGFLALPRPDQAPDTLGWGFESKYDGTGFWFKAQKVKDPTDLASGATSHWGRPIRFDTGGFSSTFDTNLTASTMWLSCQGHVYAGQGFSTDDGGGTKVDGKTGYCVPGDYYYGGIKGVSGTKPTITGSRGGNAALASLLTALHNANFLTDSTTA